MATIYEINAELLSLINEETGEIEDFEAFEALQIAREEKIKNAGLLIKEERVEIACRKAVIEALKAKIEEEIKKIGYRENTIVRLQNYILENLGEDESIDTPEVKIKRKLNPEKFVISKEDEPKLIQWLEQNNFDDCLTYSTPKLNKTNVKALSKKFADTPVPVPFGEVVRETVVKVD